MLIAQITDTHVRACGRRLHGVIDTEQSLVACIDHLLQLEPNPDLVLATGDLTDWGRRMDYSMLRREIDRLPMPVYVIPGNHDNRAKLYATFSDHGYLPEDASSGGFLHYAFDHGPYRFIGVDTVLLGEVRGGMCSDRLTWLNDRLAEHRDRPTMIFMHHPPFATGIGFMDTPFEGAAALKALIEASPQVRQIVCGHVHRAIHRNWARTTAAIGPSTVYQMNLAFAADQGFVLLDQPAAISLYLWRNEDAPVGYVSLINDRNGATAGSRTKTSIDPSGTIDPSAVGIGTG